MMSIVSHCHISPQIKNYATVCCNPKGVGTKKATKKKTHYSKKKAYRSIGHLGLWPHPSNQKICWNHERAVSKNIFDPIAHAGSTISRVSWQNALKCQNDEE